MNLIGIKKVLNVRHDIRQGVEIYVNQDIKPNYAALARQYGVDYRTAKRAF